jgi:hypothetical protein
MGRAQNASSAMIPPVRYPRQKPWLAGTGRHPRSRPGPARLLHLPPYLPDLNPIEQAFAKLKGAAADRCHLAPADGFLKLPSSQ